MNAVGKATPATAILIGHSLVVRRTDRTRFGQLLLDRLGLSFSDRRQDDLDQGIRQAFAASTCVDLDDYYRRSIDPGAGQIELDRLANAVTASRGCFFRDRAQFEALYCYVLPHIIEQHRSRRSLRIWSAGCGSGEEPYSIAMLLRELLPDVDDWSITIVGTDINGESLARARRGIYGRWSFREDPAGWASSRYCIPRGSAFELSPAVRRMVRFSRLNLAKAVYPSSEIDIMRMDLVLCRNVLTCFDPRVAAQVAGQLYESMVEGGWLVAGQSESCLESLSRFHRRAFRDVTLYQRDSLASPARPAGDLAAPQHSWLGETHAPAWQGGRGFSRNLLEQAAELLEYGCSEEARQLTLDYLALHPTDPEACTILGRAYANLGNWNESEQWCRLAVTLNKLALDAYYTLALVLHHEGRLDEAIRMMRKVVYIDQNHMLGHFGLANLYWDNGQSAQALRSLDCARRLLDGMAREELLSGSGGITAGRLYDTIVRQQQRWSGSA